VRFSPAPLPRARGCRRPERRATEYEPQTRIEGDIQQMPADFPATEIWRVLANRAPAPAAEIDYVEARKVASDTTSATA
jgi:hypothetical protein